MINKIKDFNIPANFLKIFYVFLPMLVLLRFFLGEKSFVELMVILIFISLSCDIIMRICSSKKELGHPSIFATLSKKHILCIYFEHLFWLFLTSLAIISFVKAEIYTLGFIIFGFCKSFSYFFGKQFQSEKFYDISKSEALSFAVIGFIVATFLGSFYELKLMTMLFIFISLGVMTLMDARRKMVKFNNPSLSLSVFTVLLSIFDGIWIIF